MDPINNSQTSVASITDDLISAAPPVNEGVVAAMEEKAKEDAANAANTGSPTSTAAANPAPSPSVSNVSIPAVERFDPAIHESDEFGNPRLTADNKYRRKRGRGAKAAAAALEAKSQTPPPPKVPVDYRGTAQMLCGIMFGTAKNVFDNEEWEPSPGEVEQIEEAATKYCESKQWGDFPPGIALTLVVAMYAMPRLAKPKTRVKLAEYGTKLGVIKRPPPRPASNPPVPA